MCGLFYRRSECRKLDMRGTGAPQRTVNVQYGVRRAADWCAARGYGSSLNDLRIARRRRLTTTSRPIAHTPRRPGYRLASRRFTRAATMRLVASGPTDSRSSPAKDVDERFQCVGVRVVPVAQVLGVGEQVA